MTCVTYENDENRFFYDDVLGPQVVHEWSPRLVRMNLNMVRYFLLQVITFEANEGQKDRLKSQNVSIILDQVLLE